MPNKQRSIQRLQDTLETVRVNLSFWDQTITNGKNRHSFGGFANCLQHGFRIGSEEARNFYDIEMIGERYSLVDARGWLGIPPKYAWRLFSSHMKIPKRKKDLTGEARKMAEFETLEKQVLRTINDLRNE